MITFPRERVKAEGGNVPRLAESFRIHLLAEGRSARTVQSYLEALEKLIDYLFAQTMARNIEDIHREHIEAFLADLRARGHTPSTVSNRFKGLQAFFKWAAEIEEIIPASPMAKLKPPRIPPEPPPVLTEEDLKRLLKTCEGKSFEDRRDTAIIRLLIDTGMRRSEIAGLNIEDLDLPHNYARVMGKGSKPRICPFGRKTAQALDRYLRARDEHKYADEPRRPVGPPTLNPGPELHPLWLASRGEMTGSGLFQAVAERARKAGIDCVFLHRFRHTFANAFLSAGGQETDLMLLAGWQTRQMISRYGASAASERARENYRRLSPGDRL